MFELIPDEGLVSQVERAHREESRWYARMLAAVAELSGRYVERGLAIDEDMASVITGTNRAAAELSQALNLTAAGARALIAVAEAVSERLPAVGALLAHGRIDRLMVEVVVARTALVADDLIGRVDAALAERIGTWRCWSRQRMIDAVDALVAEVDAEAVKQRRVTAFDERGVHVSREADGMARVRANLSALDGAALDARLSELAATVCAEDPRTLVQRRADALVALTQGVGLPCICERDDCPARAAEPPAPVSRQVVVNVIATEATVAGRSDRPGYLSGFGVIDAELVRELARGAVRRVVEEPWVSADAALRYRPSAALARFVRSRDLTCRFPGCSVPAERCDIDHTEPFNHADPASGGLTVPWNLACYCREHHRHKTFDGWCDRQRGDGGIVWRSPTGRRSVTTPAGAELFGRIRRARSPEERARIEAARATLAEQRPRDAAHRHRNRSAREEIRQRRWRNDARSTRVLFHGATTEAVPSASPFMRFVNEPHEVEYLEPGWQPRPMTCVADDDAPPF